MDNYDYPQYESPYQSSETQDSNYSNPGIFSGKSFTEIVVGFFKEIGTLVLWLALGIIAFVTIFFVGGLIYLALEPVLICTFRVIYYAFIVLLIAYLALIAMLVIRAIFNKLIDIF